MSKPGTQEEGGAMVDGGRLGTVDAAGLGCRLIEHYIFKGEPAMSDFEQRKIGDISVRIDRTRCIGSGNCVKIAPDVFELDAEDLVAFREEIGEVDRDTVVEACGVCPIEALLAEDAAGEQIVP